MTMELNLGKEVHEDKRGVKVSEKVEKTMHCRLGVVEDSWRPGTKGSKLER